MRRVSDGCSIASLRARLTIEVGGRAITGVYHYTRVWVREGDGHWWVAGGHVSLFSA